MFSTKIAQHACFDEKIASRAKKRFDLLNQDTDEQSGA